MEKTSTDLKVLQELFSTRRDSLKTKYGRFCLNKPKSEYIITEQAEYFTVRRFMLLFVVCV
jgi:hypothetical protein